LIQEFVLIQYSVVDVSRDGSSVLLQDEHKALHVARVHGPTPDRNQVLKGRDAKLGSHILMADNTPMRVEFLAVACSQLDALTLLHPVSEPVEAPQSVH
jgi:hypothetical protein